MVDDDDDLIIRPATLEDAADIAAVHLASWRGAYAGLISDAYLDSLDLTQRTEQWQRQLTTPSTRTWVAEREDRVCGFVSTGPCRDEDAALSAQEIYAIYLEPSAWGSGIARELLRTVLGEVPPSTRLSLWVLADNERARHFYRRHGFVVDGVERVEEIGGKDYREVRYVRS